ncbi:MAG: hypothetical protein QNL04_11190 [SAR324 cluster bacterium]|nr:hypothetical protein [SAR324 cluster bacterium]
MNKLKLIVAALTLALVLSSCSPGHQLIEPKFNVIETTDKVLEKAILDSLMSKNWIITGQELNKLTADYSRGRISVSISVHYAKGEITIIHEKSENLKYKEEEGKIYIHPTYNKWIRNLEKEIKLRVQEVKFK